MSKSVSVRVSRTKLIASLQLAIAKLNAEKDNKAQDKKLRDKWEVRYKRIPLATFQRLSHKFEVAVTDNPWRNDDSIEVTFTYYIKKDVAVDRLSYVAPVEENWRNEHGIEEIAQAIRLLELSDEDTVNTATYRSVTQYL